MSVLPLSGRAGIVTGAASGIGLAVTEAVVSAGAAVLAADRNPDALAAMSIDGAVMTKELDITSSEALDDAVRACRQEHGRLDFVVANAGVNWFGGFEDGTADDWRRVLETNVMGTALTLRAAFAELRRSEAGGHAVVTASVSGIASYAGESLYIASKWAVVGLLRALRVEWADSGVRLTLVAPGLVDTPLARSSAVGRRWLEETSALRPADVAAAITYALNQPPSVDVNEIVVRPRGQAV